MKIKLFVFIVPALLMFASTAHAQSIGNGLFTNSVTTSDHVEHASEHGLAGGQSLFAGGGSTYAQGERPLWEFGHPVEPRPLGDIAREFRQQKLATKKAEIVFEQEGSSDDKVH
jgi:hypothetical protein